MNESLISQNYNIPTMLSIAEVVKRTGLSYYYLRKGCIDGEIIHIRCGNKYLINFEKLVAKLNGEDQ